MATKDRSIKKSKFYTQIDIYKQGSFVEKQTIAAYQIKIGSQENQSGVHIVGEGVSPLHAVILFGEDGHAMVTNLSSVAGTFLNGERIAKSVLISGDTLDIGDTSLTVWFGKDGDTPKSLLTVSECLEWLEDQRVTVSFNIGCVNVKHEQTGTQCSADRFEMAISQLRKMVSKKL